MLKTLTIERAREFAEAARRKERRLNGDFTLKLAAKVRRLAREACQQGVSVLMLVEPIRSDSLRGAGMQGTLQGTSRALKNLATYEDIAFRARVKPLTPCLTSV